MRYVLVFCIFVSQLFSLQTSEKLFECTEIFKERKSELLVELERIDEQKQALSALKIATEELLLKKEANLNAKETEVNAILTEVTKKEEAIKEMLAKNEALLKELKDIKMNNVSQTFAKMKPAAASKILEEMDAKEAAVILQTLKPAAVGQILTKMNATKASELTLILGK
ncbi:MAG TPA: PDP protein [Sulfurimonas sp. UBA12504]|nr:MAG: PDP protein [Sulfurimonas sp. GWF2_37_8]DAB30707.1 MAG TPA: PDP protein [Sulfurimonas sp. UBA12504]